MSQFSTNKWLKNQYLKEANLYESQADLAAKAIDQAISGVDESLGYKDFAKAIATILKNEYGTHNFNPFMEVLHAELGIKESLNESKGAKNYFDDLKFNYQKAFRYLEEDEKEEYKQLAKNFFSSIKEAQYGSGYGYTNDELRGTDFSDEFKEKFDVKAFVDDNKVEIIQRGDIDDDMFEEMIKFIEGKGYTVDRKQSEKTYDYDPGERDFYPRIKFSK